MAGRSARPVQDNAETRSARFKDTVVCGSDAAGWHRGEEWASTEHCAPRELLLGGVQEGHCILSSSKLRHASVKLG